MKIVNIRWRRYVNTKENVRHKIKNLFDLQKKGIKARPHELLIEWDGKIDGFLLIEQIMKLKNEIQYQRSQPKESLASRMQNKKNIGNDRGFSNQDAHPSSSSMNQYAPKSSAQDQPRYEVNPKLKLSRKKKEDLEDTYVTKQDNSRPLKGMDASELEYQFVRKREPEPKGLSAEDIERQKKDHSNVANPVNAEDLENMLAGKPAKPQPTDIDEIEALMRKGVSK